ncbi:MAG: UDP-glucose 4-epimerase GalE [Nitrospinae bacterium]|nr:UDP-glucose 4-epimerase GalE [Nitrospinota bacterium]MBF0633682.1 UDP-glucose 4-epimerase GalE [Nitrospinota bacterium]
MPTPKRTAVVTGGAGYIGSHCVAELRRAGWETVVVDNLVHGHRKAVTGGAFAEGDVGDKRFMESVFSRWKTDVVFHFAGFAYVGESVKDPAKYYRNNVAGGLGLLSAMTKAGVKSLVFSSTCAVYGVPSQIPIPETHPTNPINPYGMTKLMFERIMADFGSAHGLRYVILRYFNAAGADLSGTLGEDHDPETHLIPLAIDSAIKPDSELTIYGTDYPTPDGTCVRDYIHVNDLVEAHLLAADYLASGGASDIFNLGNGAGRSVREIVETVGRVAGKPVRFREGARREGDPPRLIGSSSKAETILGWKPKLTSLDEMISSALRWRIEHPEGYGE